MQKKSRIRSLIRFQRWSRKGYAIFRSLGQIVSIGQLNKDIANSSLEKQKPQLLSTHTHPAVLQEADNEDTEPLPGLVAGLSGLPLWLQPQAIAVQTNCAAGSPCPVASIISHLEDRIKYAHAHLIRSSFLFHLTPQA